MANLAESTEALKRNVLVRGFFDDRGFYDLNDITAVDYRQGALAGEHREPIRIWLRADLLFATGAAGSAEARHRDVCQMADRRGSTAPWPKMLRYPKDTPLIVEGYAVGEHARRARPPIRRARAGGARVHHQALWVVADAGGNHADG